MIDERLSRAIVLYFSHRNYPVEDQGDAELAAAFGAREQVELRARIQELIKSAFAAGTGFTTLDSAAEAVERSLRQTSPGLSDQALESLMWYWFYCNK